MPMGQHGLVLNGAEWDAVADALVRCYLTWMGWPSYQTEALRLRRILTRMHRARPQTASRREADKVLGDGIVEGHLEAVRLPWDTPERVEARRRQVRRRARRMGVNDAETHLERPRDLSRPQPGDGLGARPVDGGGAAPVRKARTNGHLGSGRAGAE